MKARDKRPPNEYKGRPTGCCESVCPCRPCWNPHDCGYNEKVYKDGLWTANKWVEQMECGTRFNNSCPGPKPEPEHIFTPRGYVCKRCGARRKELEK